MNAGLFLIIAICCGLLPIIISVNEKIRRIKEVEHAFMPRKFIEVEKNP